jgi:hypothetical protein
VGKFCKIKTCYKEGESVDLQEGAQEVEKRLESLDALRGFANCRL